MAKAKKKVSKRIARRKTTKKAVAKKSVKKVKVAVPTSKKVRIGNFAFEPFEHPKFPSMVVVTNAPKWAKEVIGKKYVDEGFATKTINSLLAERVVDSGAKSAKGEIKSVIGETIEPLEIQTVNVDYYGVE
jgi:hypothetical protein